VAIGKNDRVLKFSKTPVIKTWGTTEAGPGEFVTSPTTSRSVDSQARVYVADRSNSRVQIFDQDGNFIAG